ncbi:hypothetical protein [Bowmanella denitrificans]|uniref:hypothetical protein n=1 Tax=Bowmanella denitrificans TaxID=366582 RepID=UPI000C9C1920|nr:hypothetical protein [Bowmanella denitrificans]
MYRVAVLFFMLFAFCSYAENAWYWGKVTTLITSGPDGSFQVHLENQDIKSKCTNGVVYFKVSHMGLERTKLAYAMGLAALTSGREWGVVVDLPNNGAMCFASSTASQGAGLR